MTAPSRVDVHDRRNGSHGHRGRVRAELLFAGGFIRGRLAGLGVTSLQRDLVRRGGGRDDVEMLDGTRCRCQLLIRRRCGFRPQ